MKTILTNRILLGASFALLVSALGSTTLPAFSAEQVVSDDAIAAQRASLVAATEGKGYGTGYVYSGQLSAAELAPIDCPVGKTEHGDLQPVDTIELHYVHTSAKLDPGPPSAPA